MTSDEPPDRSVESACPLRPGRHRDTEVLPSQESLRNACYGYVVGKFNPLIGEGIVTMR